MSRVVLFLVALIALCASAFGQTLPKYAYAIQFQTVVEKTTCGAAAIGPHAVLTATHCERGANTIALQVFSNDGLAIFTNIKVFKVLRDNKDHSIVLLPNVKFDEWEKIRKTPLLPGDNVSGVGHPGELYNMLRKGYFSGKAVRNGEIVYFFDLNGYLGDSGMSLFDDNGDIAAVLSAIYEEEQGEVRFKFVTAYPLNFTEAQLEEAGK